MAIRGLLFDKDGTLFDFQATWGAWAAGMIEEFFPGRTAEAEALLDFDLARRHFGPSSPVIAETTERLAEIVRPLLPGLSVPELVTAFRTRAAGTPQVPAVPLRPLFEALSARGLRLGIATNDNESSARAHLDRAGIADLFGFVAGYDSGWGGKPASGQVDAFLGWAGLAPAEAAMVGDSLHDLHAGRGAGVWTVGVLTGAADRHVLTPHADVVLDDIGGLPGWLDRRPA